MSELLTAEEVAQALKCSTAAVRRWTLEGLPFYPAGRLRRFKIDTVQRWLEEKEAARLAARVQRRAAGKSEGQSAA